jgi:RNase adaptor protein for sRNA GlmZ degradation
VRFHVPQRGAKLAFLETVTENAREAFQRTRLKRASDFESRSRALKELQDALDLDEAPLRIECFDISHLGGSEVVGSMVVFEDGLPKKSDYRRFKLSVDVNDDYANMREVIRRRFLRFAEERAAPVVAEGEDGPRRFAYPPNLVIVDGGVGQLNAALEGTRDLAVDDVAFVGLAKRFEELWVPGRSRPVVLPRGSEALYLVQRVRDEAHRFAITYQRTRRSKAVASSALDGVPGVGPARRKALFRRFGSVAALRRATVDELMEVPGVSRTIATAVHDHLHQRGHRVTTDDVISEPHPPAHPHRVRHVGRRPFHRLQRAGGPRVVRDRQPAPDADRPGGRARVHPGSSVGARPGRRRPGPRVLLRARRHVRELQHGEADVRVLYLEADDDALVRRFEETRRRHPAADDAGVLAGIRRERTMLAELRGMADLIVDTTDLNVHELRERLEDAVADESSAPLRIEVVSFGFKRGPRATSTCCSTSASCPTPTGSTSSALHGQGPAGPRLRVRPAPHRAVHGRAAQLLDVLVPGYVEEGKRYLTIGIGCTGGKHRSVAISDDIGRHLAETTGLPVTVEHRDLGHE